VGVEHGQEGESGEVVAALNLVEVGAEVAGQCLRGRCGLKRGSVGGSGVEFDAGVNEDGLARGECA